MRLPRTQRIGPRLLTLLTPAVLAAASLLLGPAAPPSWAAARFAQPLTHAVWRAGTDQAILWSDASPGMQPLRLMRGSSTALQEVMTLAMVDGAANRYSWAIPAGLPADSTYAIALGTNPDIGYSGQFTITSAATAPPPPGPPAPSPSAV